MSNQESVNFLENINGLYGSNTYLEKNGMSIIIAAVIIIIVFSIITYSEISNHLNDIKQDWTEYRCKPQYMPLAGIINAPIGESTWGYTAKNFEFCINSILSDVAGFMTNPTTIVISLFEAALGVVNAIMGKLSGFISTVRTDVMKFAQDVVARVLNLLVPIIEIWHKILDIFKRTSGFMGFIFYFVDLIFFAVIAWVNLVVKVITDWVLFTFKVMGITGLILMVPLLLLMFQIIVSLIAEFVALLLYEIGFGLEFFPLTILPGSIMATVGVTEMAVAFPLLAGVSTAYAITAIVSFIATSLVMLVIQIYELFVINPMMDLLDLFPGFIKTPPDKNMGDVLWWANAVNITKDFVKPVKFSSTADVKKQQANADAVKSSKSSPSGLSVSGQLASAEGFRNIFY